VDVDVGQALSRVLAPGEEAERSIDLFISRQHEKRIKEEGDRKLEEAWKESSRKHAEKRRLQARAEWHLHHTEQAERLRNTLESLIEHHEQQAEPINYLRARLHGATS
jgi:hypothetical protein